MRPYEPGEPWPLADELKPIEFDQPLTDDECDAFHAALDGNHERESMMQIDIRQEGGPRKLAIRNALVEVMANAPEGIEIAGALTIEQPLRAWGGVPIGQQYATVEVTFPIDGHSLVSILNIAAGCDD